MSAEKKETSTVNETVLEGGSLLHQSPSDAEAASCPESMIIRTQQQPEDHNIQNGSQHVPKNIADSDGSPRPDATHSLNHLINTEELLTEPSTSMAGDSSPVSLSIAERQLGDHLFVELAVAPVSGPESHTTDVSDEMELLDGAPMPDATLSLNLLTDPSEELLTELSTSMAGESSSFSLSSAEGQLGDHSSMELAVASVSGLGSHTTVVSDEMELLDGAPSPNATLPLNLLTEDLLLTEPSTSMAGESSSVSLSIAEGQLGDHSLMELAAASVSGIGSDTSVVSDEMGRSAEPSYGSMNNGENSKASRPVVASSWISLPCSKNAAASSSDHLTKTNGSPRSPRLNEEAMTQETSESETRQTARALLLLSENGEQSGDCMNFHFTTSSTPSMNEEEAVEPANKVLRIGNEEVAIFCDEQATLFHLEPESTSWKDKGLGSVRIVSRLDEPRYRILMQRDQDLICNYAITSDITLYFRTSAPWMWIAINGPVMENFIVHFNSNDRVVQFKALFDMCQKLTKTEAGDAASVSPMSDTVALAASANPATSGHSQPADVPVNKKSSRSKKARERLKRKREEELRMAEAAAAGQNREDDGGMDHDGESGNAAHAAASGST